MFAERIKKIRKDLSLTQEDFADKIGISIDTIQKWEKGTSTPCLSIAKSMAQKLEVSLGYLIGVTDNKNEKSSYDTDNNMFFFKYGAQEVKIPGIEENKQLFFDIVKEMVGSHNESSPTKINMQDNINGSNNVRM